VKGGRSTTVTLQGVYLVLLFRSRLASICCSSNASSRRSVHFIWSVDRLVRLCGGNLYAVKALREGPILLVQCSHSGHIYTFAAIRRKMSSFFHYEDVFLGTGAACGVRQLDPAVVYPAFCYVTALVILGRRRFCSGGTRVGLQLYGWLGEDDANIEENLYGASLVRAALLVTISQQGVQLHVCSDWLCLTFSQSDPAKTWLHTFGIGVRRMHSNRRSVETVGACRLSEPREAIPSSLRPIKECHQPY
jgi:hypothetical protein